MKLIEVKEHENGKMFFFLVVMKMNVNVMSMILKRESNCKLTIAKMFAEFRICRKNCR